MPNKHDGKGYRRVAAHPESVSVFCAWSLIVQVASKCPERGTLRDEDGPLDALDLAAKTGYPAHIFESAFLVLTDTKVGWLETVNDDVDQDALPAFCRKPGDTPAEAGRPPTCMEGEGITEQVDGRSRSHQRRAETPRTGVGDSPRKPVAVPEDVFLVFPTVGGKRTQDQQWALTETFAAELSSTYPAVDVRQVCKELLQWVKANPARRKTAAGMADFLNRNIAKRQNRGGGYEQVGNVRGGGDRPSTNARSARQDHAANALITGAADRVARARGVRGGGEPPDS